MPSGYADRLLAGRYRLHRQVSAGDFSEVWRGTDVVLGRPVAVQILSERAADDAAMLARLREKARQTGAVIHQGIARVYDYDDSGIDGPPFLVMESIDGTSLAEILAAGPMEPARVMGVLAQIAAALHAVHEAGLVHCAIEPEHVLLGPDDVVKLTGFTSSQALDRAEDGEAADDVAMLGGIAGRCLGSGPGLPDDVTAFIDELTGSEAPPAAEAARRAGELRDLLGAIQAPDPDPEPVPVPAPDSDPVGSTSPMRRINDTWRRRRILAAAAAAAAVVLALVVLRIVGPGPQPDARAASRPVYVDVNGAALRGRQVAVVRVLLRREGLRVRVRWQQTYRLPPGEVLSVSPSGRILAGTVVTLTGALTPQGMPSATVPTAPVGGHRAGQPGSPRHRRPRPSPSSTPTTASPMPSHPGMPTPSPSPSPTSSPTPTTDPNPNPTTGTTG